VDGFPVEGTIKAGRYEIDREHGLALGKYRVKIRGVGSTVVPPRYNNESQILIEVKASGDNRFDFAMDQS
jgi:hypothetical protein